MRLSKFSALYMQNSTQSETDIVFIADKMVSGFYIMLIHDQLTRQATKIAGKITFCNWIRIYNAFATHRCLWEQKVEEENLQELCLCRVEFLAFTGTASPFFLYSILTRDSSQEAI